MLPFSYVLFDLDGTLTDSAPGIANGILYALERQGIEGIKAESLYQYAGPPLHDIFADVAPSFDETHIQRAMEDYRVYYRESGWRENRLYPGALPFLERLREAGLQLAVASSKGDYFVRKICDYFQITPYCHHVCGSDAKRNLVHKDQVVEYAIARFDAAEKEEIRRQTALVGDRSHDVEGGHHCGIKVLGVTFGYGGRAELESAGCDWIFDSFEELGDFLLQKAP